MAIEYQTTGGGNRQWRNLSAGVQGWNNLERDETSPGVFQKKPEIPKPPPRPVATPTSALAAATPRPTPAAAPAQDAPLAGLTAIQPEAQQQMMLPTGGETTNIMGGGEEEPMFSLATPSLGQLRPLGRRSPPSLAALLRVGVY